jgi:hypothetical protein
MDPGERGQRERNHPMSKFLIFVPLPEEQAGLGEQIIRSAVCFGETQGKTERVSLGDFKRQGRKDTSVESLKLVELRTAGAVKDEIARGRALEGILRSTLAAAGARAGEVPVFVSEG